MRAWRAHESAGERRRAKGDLGGGGGGDHGVAHLVAPGQPASLRGRQALVDRLELRHLVIEVDDLPPPPRAHPRTTRHQDRPATKRRRGNKRRRMRAREGKSRQPGRERGSHGALEAAASSGMSQADQAKGNRASKQGSTAARHSGGQAK
jgi:hypothetical protein